MSSKKERLYRSLAQKPSKDAQIWKTLRTVMSQIGLIQLGKQTTLKN